MQSGIKSYTHVDIPEIRFENPRRIEGKHIANVSNSRNCILIRAPEMEVHSIDITGNKCVIKFVVDSKKSDFYKFMYNLNTHCISQVSSNIKKWFRQDLSGLTEQTLNNCFRSPFMDTNDLDAKLLVVEIPLISGNITIPIFNENKQNVGIRDVNARSVVIPVLCFNGIWISKNNFGPDFVIYALKIASSPVVPKLEEPRGRSRPTPAPVKDAPAPKNVRDAPQPQQRTQAAKPPAKPVADDKPTKTQDAVERRAEKSVRAPRVDQSLHERRNNVVAAKPSTIQRENRYREESRREAETRREEHSSDVSHDREDSRDERDDEKDELDIPDSESDISGSEHSDHEEQPRTRSMLANPTDVLKKSMAAAKKPVERYRGDDRDVRSAGQKQTDAPKMSVRTVQRIEEERPTNRYKQDKEEKGVPKRRGRPPKKDE